MSWGAVAGAAVSVVGGSLLNDGGGSSGASDAAAISAQSQAETAKKQEARNDEMWQRFKEKYWPLEDQLLDENYRNVKDRSEERAAEAGDAVTSSFSAQRDQSNRELSRAGINPADGKFRALNRTYDMGEAAARADAQNDARTQERQRVEDTNYNRALQVMSLGRNIPAQVSSGTSSAASMYGSNAGIYTNLAQMLAKDQGNLASGLGNLATKAINGFNKSGGWDGGTPSETADRDDAQTNMFSDPQYGEGGEVVGPSHEQGGKTINAEGGEYVIPVDVVQDIGVHRLEKMIADSKKRVAERGRRGNRPPQALRRH